MSKKDKGITLTSLVITVVIILILTSAIVININTGDSIDRYRKMCADIDMLKDQILIYYNKYGDIPKGSQIADVSNIQEAQREEGDFYQINLAKLNNLTLNYGTSGNNDIYIINEQSLNIYYLKGVQYNEKIVHTKE